jgi:hypothetical protein
MHFRIELAHKMMQNARFTSAAKQSSVLTIQDHHKDINNEYTVLGK